MDDGADLLFVYGSLKKAGGNRWAAGLWATADDLGPATVAGRIYSLGAYPGLIEGHSGSDVVHGELMRLHDPATTLPSLDDYEGREYRRAVVPVTLESGEVREAWAYLFTGTVDESSRILTGRWTPPSA